MIADTKWMRRTGPVLVLLLAVFAVQPSLAGGRKASSKPERAAVDTNDRITAVDLTSITVTVGATHASVHYRVTSATKISVNGAAAGLSSITAGMDVRVKPGAEPSVAGEIEATSAGSAGTAEPPKKKR